jgi:hypothetical protein
MLRILRAMILLGLIGILISISLSSAWADKTQTIVIRELKFDKPMPVKSGDTVRFIVRLENPSSIDSANFSIALSVFTKTDGTGVIFSLREQYSHLNAHNARSIMLAKPFTIPMDYKNVYIWVAILDFPGEKWPDNQQSDQKSYQLPGDKLAVTGAHTAYKYGRILPYPMNINVDILRIPTVPIK